MGSVHVRKVIHDKRGPGFTFDMTDHGWTQWNWQQMLSHLDEDSLKYVVQGPESRSSGILKCSVDPRPGSYDHKTQVQVAHKRQLLIYDFVILRNDGSRCYMHPHWQGTKIDCQEGLPSEPAQVPAKGLGMSDGHGTFRTMVSSKYNYQLRFRYPL